MDKNCSVYKAVDIFGKKWTLLILQELYKKNWKRYSEIKKAVPGITPKILSARLKELEQEEIVVKETDARKFPIKCEYSLTQSGEDLVDILKEIKKWSIKWKASRAECCEIDCKKCRL